MTAAWVLLALAALVLLAVVLLCVGRARRLDRLHVRTDAARAALVAALDRRAAAALAVAYLARPPTPENRTLGPERGNPHPDSSVLVPECGLGAAARRARVAPDGGREAAENALGRALAAVDRTALPAGLAAELADAETLVVLARRVHNDAVRDTLDLRSRRLVRWLRLAGTAPRPAYFEIADPEPTPRPTGRAPGGADVRSGANQRPIER